MLTQVANTDHSTMVARISAVFSETMHVDVPSAETDLFDTGILDSQRFVELLLQIEQNFHTQINIENCELENFRCIDKIASFVAQHQSA
jgi:methoxymalonate biosynthesis acyl carrier protein